MNRTNTQQLHTYTIPEIQPKGWLLRQLQIQMDGLTGRLYDIWDSVGSYSGWLGGTGENWERGPYYLDGLLPLSYYLKDKKHWDIACRFIEWTLNSQEASGNFGPKSSMEDYWSRFVMLKVLKQYYEITKDSRILDLFDHYFRYLKDTIITAPMKQWSRARMGDLLYCLNWFSRQRSCDYLQELADLLRQQALDWTDIFKEFPFIRPASYYYNWKMQIEHFHPDDLDVSMNFHTTHIVNVTMGFKYPGMLSYFYDDEDYKEIALKGLESAEKYHGVASGAINGDEHLSGNNPSQGAELCSIVEYMFSLQTLLEAFGCTSFADRLEKLAYNALPATITEDFMAHQYLQQANQVMADKSRRNWFNNNDESNTYGLEPNFGCCTANMHQGWPKFVQSLWFHREEDTVVSMVYAPSVLTTTIQGKELCITEDTDYPFKNRIHYQLNGEGAKLCTLQLRVPEWCKNFTLYKNGVFLGDASTLSVKEQFLTLHDLNDGDAIEFYPAMEALATHWFHNSIAVERGPLVYALNPKERWLEIRRTAGATDYAVYPESDWNYALSSHTDFTVKENAVNEIPFSGKGYPVEIKAKAKKLDSWKVECNSAGVLPVSPVTCSSEEEEITLVPYGCTKLRITQFPYYN